MFSWTAKTHKIYRAWFVDSDSEGEVMQTEIYTFNPLTLQQAAELLVEQLEASAIHVEWLDVLRLQEVR